MTGDTPDILNRLQRLIPASWFPAGASALRDAVLTGVANSFAFVYSALGYLRNQTRIRTATDGFLDLISGDFFGNTILRSFNQSDASFRATIQANLFRERNTRRSVIQILQQLTGFTPLVFEPQRVPDAGAYNVGTAAYNVAGGYGSPLPYQAFVTAFVPNGEGVPNVAGYGIPTGAYSTPSQSEYVDQQGVRNQLTYADIYDAINAVRPAATILWVRILSAIAAAAAPAGPRMITESGVVIDLESGVPLLLG